MADRGTQLALKSLIQNIFIAGDTYTPFVYVPVNYGENLSIKNGSIESNVSIPTEGQLWPRGNS